MMKCAVLCKFFASAFVMSLLLGCSLNNLLEWDGSSDGGPPPLAPTAVSLNLERHFSITRSAPLSFTSNPLATSTQVQLYRSEDNAIVEPWVTATSPYQSSLNLERGKKYYYKLRSVNSSGVSSEVTSGEFLAQAEIPCVNGPVRAILHANDQIYIGGSFTRIAPCSGPGVIIDSITGESANALDSLAKVRGSISAVLPDGSGGFYIGGEFKFVGTTPRNHLARINADGSLHAWNPDVNDSVTSLETDGTSIFAGGHFTRVNQATGNLTRNYLASFEPDTGTATAFDADLDAYVNALETDGTNLFAGGNFTKVNQSTTNDARNYMAAFNLTTGITTAFNPNLNEKVYAIVYDGEDIFACGSFTDVNGGTTRNRLASFNPFTGNATPFDPNLNGVCYALTYDGTNIFSGGTFTDVNSGTTRNRLASFNPSTSNVTAFNPNLSGTCRTLTYDGTSIFAGGTFTDVNSGTTRRYLASFNPSTGMATAFNPSPSNGVLAMAIEGTKMYIGGYFEFFSEGSHSRNNIASFSQSTGVISNFDPDINNTVRALAFDGSNIFVGGDFARVNQSTTNDVRNRLASFHPDTGEVTVFNPNMNGIVRALLYDGTSIFAGGSFTFVNGVSTKNRLASFDPVAGTTNLFNPNLDNVVLALAFDGANIFAGGGFTTVDGGATARNRLASFNPITGNVTSFDPNPNGSVYALVFDGSNLIAGGSFTDVNSGTTRNRLTSFNPNNGIATNFNPDLDSNVLSLTLLDSHVYAGGWFNTVAGGGTDRYDFGSFESSTGGVGPLNPAINDEVLSLAHDGNNIYIGGSFNAGSLAPSSADYPYCAFICAVPKEQ